MGIEVKSLSKSFGDTTVLSDINFHIPCGETAVLLGASGAGKSTLLRMLNLLDTPDSGELNIAGCHFQFNPSHSKVPAAKACQLRRKVGMVFQQYHLWPHMTVMGNLIEAPVSQGMPKQDAIQKGREVLSRLDLISKENAWPLSLSGGQQQRVAIARALMQSPDVLLFDEPTAALDPAITQQVAHIIHELGQSNITQVIVTHEVEFARKVASQVIYLEGGKIIELGSARHFDEPETESFKAYLRH